MNHINIYAVVVTYNGSRWIDKCFGSMVNSNILVSVIAVDNVSSDGTPGIIRQKYPSVEVIETGQNLGFGKANNIGLKLALCRNFDYAFLLNQDAWIEPTAIEKMVHLHQENSKYGILSPLHYAGDMINLDNNFSNYINGFACPGLTSDAISNRKLKEIYDIDFVNAAFWLISRQVLEKVGGFDPLFLMYGEDRDYIQRVKSHEFKVGICPSAIGYHDRPQNLPDSDNSSVERLFGSRLAELKDFNKPLPLKRIFYMTVLKLKLKSLLYGENHDKQIKLNKKIISEYSEIKNHRDLCKIPASTFL